MVLSPVTEVLRLAAEEKRASGALSCLPVGGKIQIQIQIQGDTGERRWWKKAKEKMGNKRWKKRQGVVMLGTRRVYVG